MAEYIDRESLLKHKRKMSGADFGGDFWDEDVLVEDILNEPTADVVEVQHGEWIGEIVKRNDWRGKEQSYYQPNSCSLCHTGLAFRTNFCPNCGAKMDGKGEDNAIG